MSRKGRKKWPAVVILLFLIGYVGKVVSVNLQYREKPHSILCQMGEVIENKGIRIQVNGFQEYGKEEFIRTFGEAALKGEEDALQASEDAYYILVEVQIENPTEERISYDLWNWDLTGNTWHWAMNPRISRNINGGEEISQISLDVGEQAVYQVAYSFYDAYYRKPVWEQLHTDEKRLVQIYHPQLIEIKLGGKE